MEPKSPSMDPRWMDCGLVIKPRRGPTPPPTPQLGPHTRVIRKEARDVYLFWGKERNCLLISLWFQLRQRL